MGKTKQLTGAACAFADAATETISFDPLYVFKPDTDKKTVFFSGRLKNDLHIDNPGSVPVRFNEENEPYELKSAPDTYTYAKHYKAGDEICVEAKIGRNRALWSTFICPRKQYNLLPKDANATVKEELLKWYMLLSPAHQKRIHANADSPVKYSECESKTATFSTRGDMKNYFRMVKNTYTPQQQQHIESLLNEVSIGITPNQKTMRKLEYILNIDSSCNLPKALSKEKIIYELGRYVYGLDTVKTAIAEAIVAGTQYSKSNKGLRLLLVGSPGVAKTTIMQAVAKVLGMKFALLSLGAVTSKLDIVGISSIYENSDFGEVVKHFYNCGTSQIVLGLDEFEKVVDVNGKDGSVIPAFADMLSDDGFIKDDFLGTYVRTDNTVFIASANDISEIPDYIKNRFTIIHIDDYTLEEKITIAKCYILPKLFMNNGVKIFDEIEFPDDTIAHIAENYCEDNGARDLKKNLEAITKHILCLWHTSQNRVPISVTIKFADRVLSEKVNKASPIIIFRQNRALYSPEVANEINTLIAKSRKTGLEPHVAETNAKRLDYLTKLVPKGNCFKDFSPEKFLTSLNETHYGLSEVKERIAKLLYLSSVREKAISSTRILLLGPPGVGKSSIAESIAAALNAPYQKVSLNGISDAATLKGHSSAYIGADAGSIVRAAARAGTTRLVMHLDEIDKLVTDRQGQSPSSALIDMLDDSANVTDSFIGLPLDFSDTMFIATANDLSTVDPILLNRFTVIETQGYTKEEKKQIAKDYILPRVIPNKSDISMTEDAIDYIIEKHCRSAGVRDIKRAVERAVEDKVYAMQNGENTKAVITKKEVKKSLGAPPPERGNYPSIAYPGLAKALAVTGGGGGMTFAVESAVIEGDTSLTVTGLPRETVLDSVKLVMSYIRRNYSFDLEGKGMHIHFNEGAVPKEGPSAGVAILVSVLSALMDKNVSDGVAFTGEISLHGNVFAVGGTVQKVAAAVESGCTRVFIPSENYVGHEKEYAQFKNAEVIPVKHVSEVIEKVL